jgi:hypothetical protein
MIPTPTVKVEVVNPAINKVIGHPDSNIHIECRRIDELGSFLNINFWRRRVLYWFRRHLGRWWWRHIERCHVSLSHDRLWRWRRCDSYGFRRRGCYTAAISWYLISIGIHTLDIGIVIPSLGFSAIDPT